MPENGSRSGRSAWFRHHPDPYHGPYPAAFLAEVDRVDAQHRARIDSMKETDAVTIIGAQVLVFRQPAWWREHVLRQQAQVAADHRARCREMAARV